MNDRPASHGRQSTARWQKVLSLAEARRAAQDSRQYLLWLSEKHAQDFHEPGWLKREPARNGSVLFVHPQREIRAARERGIL